MGILKTLLLGFYIKPGDIKLSDAGLAQWLAHVTSISNHEAVGSSPTFGFFLRLDICRCGVSHFMCWGVVRSRFPSSLFCFCLAILD